MSAVLKRLQRDHQMLRMKIESINHTIAGALQEHWMLLRESGQAVMQALADHHEREQEAIAACRSRESAQRLTGVLVEHTQHIQSLRHFNGLVARGGYPSSPALATRNFCAFLASLLHELDVQEHILYPYLERCLGA